MEALKSISITVIVSAVISWFISGYISFWKTFLLVTLVQYIGWYIFQQYIQIRRDDLQKLILSDIASQSIIAPCAYCKVENMVPIRFDQDNEFACEGCNKKSAIYIDIETVQITVPVGTERTIKVNESI